MPAGFPPPEAPKITLRMHRLPAGAPLWRVQHRLAVGPFTQGSHEPARSAPELGGRFHPCAEHDYPYAYLALDDLTAVAETLLRGLSFRGPLRSVPRDRVAARELVLMETVTDLNLISLVHAEDLAAACQDTWLIHTEAQDYWLTRCWGHWLRELEPHADGLIWPSKRNPDGRAMVLFGDRCADQLVSAPYPPRRLDDKAGADWLDRRLMILNTYLAPETPGSGGSGGS